MAMSFLLLLIFGLIQISLLAATKYMVNLAAFSAARAVMTRGMGTLQTSGYEAASGVLDNIRWWSAPSKNRPEWPLERRTREVGMGKSRNAIVVIQRVPFGLPIFNAIPAGGLPVAGYAPYVEQPCIAVEGDNTEVALLGIDVPCF